MKDTGAVLGILQARTSSSRLPGKVLMPILGIPMLEHQLRRLLRCRRMGRLLVATSDQASDDPVAAMAAGMGLGCYRGSLEDVLDRYYRAAVTVGGDGRAGASPGHIVRVTGDCPLTDPAVIDQAIGFHLAEGADYTSNTLQPTWPHGLDVEVVRFPCLEEAWREAVLPSEREHVTPFINTRPSRYHIAHFKHGTDLSGYRWTVDYPEDFELVRQVYQALYPANPDFGMEDILALMDRQPGLREINRGFRRYAGLEKSHAADRKFREGKA